MKTSYFVYWWCWVGGRNKWKVLRGDSSEAFGGKVWWPPEPFFPSRRKLSTKSKKWKSIFNLGRSGSESKSKLSRNGSVFVRAQKLSGKNTLSSWLFLSEALSCVLVAWGNLYPLATNAIDLRPSNGVVLVACFHAHLLFLWWQETPFQEDLTDSYSKYCILVPDKWTPVVLLSSLGTRKCLGISLLSQPSQSLPPKAHYRALGEWLSF